MAKFPGLMMFAAMLLMRAGTAQAADAACARPDVPLSPLMATHTLPPYPQMSVMTKEEGAVMLMVHIDAGGVPTAVEVDTSSGSVRLDEAARDQPARLRHPTGDCPESGGIRPPSQVAEMVRSPD